MRDGGGETHREAEVVRRQEHVELVKPALQQREPVDRVVARVNEYAIGAFVYQLTDDFRFVNGRQRGCGMEREHGEDAAVVVVRDDAQSRAVKRGEGDGHGGIDIEPRR